ncbi:hypothetical protein [Alysiella crassa]|nr:hypothetical protein [Alysiella crassa]
MGGCKGFSLKKFFRLPFNTRHNFCRVRTTHPTSDSTRQKCSGSLKAQTI